MYLPEGCTRPERARLDAFWAVARTRVPTLGAQYQVRWIGLDAPTTRQIFDLIRAGDKTGTFGLPWVFERTGQPVPRRGDELILIDFDGSPVRDLAVWKPLHTQYWNSLLKPFNLAVNDEMPCWAEPFDLVYDGGSTG